MQWRKVYSNSSSQPTLPGFTRAWQSGTTSTWRNEWKQKKVNGLLEAGSNHTCRLRKISTAAVQSKDLQHHSLLQALYR